MAKIHKWSRLQFLMLECKSWFETVHTRGTNENTICLCRKGIYELMVESSSTTMALIDKLSRNTCYSFFYDGVMFTNLRFHVKTGVSYAV